MVPFHHSINNEYHHKRMRGRKNTKKKEILSIKWGGWGGQGGGKSLNVGLLSSAVECFLFSIGHCFLPSFGNWSAQVFCYFFSVGTFAGVSITRPLPNLRSPGLSCMGGSSYNSAIDVLLHILALVPIPKFSPWWST